MSKPAEEQEQRKKEEEQKTQSHRILPYSNIDLLAAGSPTSTLLPPRCHRPTKHLCTLAFHKILGTLILASSFTNPDVCLDPDSRLIRILLRGGMYGVVHPQ